MLCRGDHSGHFASARSENCTLTPHNKSSKSPSQPDSGIFSWMVHFMQIEVVKKIYKYPQFPKGFSRWFLKGVFFLRPLNWRLGGRWLEEGYSHICRIPGQSGLFLSVPSAETFLTWCCCGCSPEQLSQDADDAIHDSHHLPGTLE